jgi:type IV secretory pathway VirB2 component (pilin)
MLAVAQLQLVKIFVTFTCSGPLLKTANWVVAFVDGNAAGRLATVGCTLICPAAKLAMINMAITQISILIIRPYL